MDGKEETKKLIYGHSKVQNIGEECGFTLERSRDLRN